MLDKVFARKSKNSMYSESGFKYSANEKTFRPYKANTER